MRLASIYIHYHQYLFNEPQTLNFGGEYLYYFKMVRNHIKVTRVKNQQFIPNFFNVTSALSKVELLSAIVGQNGIGKSSILDCIRSIFIGNVGALPDVHITVIFEEEEEIKVIDSGYVVYLSEGNQIKRLKFVEKNYIQTIYYSPHFDLKYNFNFSDVDAYNISSDTYIEKDLEDLDKKDSNESGFRYHPVEELVFKNSMRQISFLSSNIYRENNIFYKLLSIPRYESGILFFREYKIDEQYWNVPRVFGYFFRKLFKKIDEENDGWVNIRKFNENHDVLNQAEIWCYLLERKIISCFCSVIIEQMNKQNIYLEEGFFNVEDLDASTNNIGSLDLLYFLLEHSYIDKGHQKFKVFKHENAFELINYILETIRKVDDEYKISKSSIQLNFEQISEILKLHRSVLLDLFNYYPSQDGLLRKSSYVDGFIGFRPTDKFLSSGENALLNFYSKLYDFVNTNLLEESKFLGDKKQYIFLLDEADLGYHPTWKKKFVYSIINTLPYFFQNLRIVPNLQIIFTTHDPLTLSDVPNNSVVYLKKEGKFSKILKSDDLNRPKNTFGANVHELLADSFFIEDGLLGEFAKEKIQDLVLYLTYNENLRETEENIKYTGVWDKQSASNLIQIVGEPIIKERLQSLFDRKFLTSEKESLELRIKELQQKLDELNEKDIN
ncbi:AAA family ATPase [Flavobacterium sp. RNTU_13]|uniref:AAA family ATPase n=1 Tax=Flavobacterium sp. RNTU_13 TaxID=3375145 RepID=UPI0039859DA3